MAPNIDLHDARWFPVDMDVQGRRYAFLRIEEQVLENSSFLDTRIEAPLSEAVAWPAEPAAQLLVSSRVGWLLHTSFCGSTLLARILHAPPHNVCLREPLVLRRLGDAKHAGQEIDDLVKPTIALLSRPWSVEGSVVIKPTHAALNVAVDMLMAAPGSRALALTSSLDDFLVSNLKKSAESQAKIPLLAERAVEASAFHLRLPAAAFAPPDLLCAAVIQWAAQRELLKMIVDVVGLSRIRVLDMNALLEDLSSAAVGTAKWLRLEIPDADLHARCRREGSRNAKAIDAPYSASQRAEDSRFLERAFAPIIASAREWASENVLPYMHSQALNVTSSWTLT